MPLSHQQLTQFIVTSYDPNIHQCRATPGCTLPSDVVRFQTQGWSGQTDAFTILCIWRNYAKKQHHSLALSLSWGHQCKTRFPLLGTHLFICLFSSSISPFFYLSLMLIQFPTFRRNIGFSHCAFTDCRQQYQFSKCLLVYGKSQPATLTVSPNFAKWDKNVCVPAGFRNSGMSLPRYSYSVLFSDYFCFCYHICSPGLWATE